MDSDTSTIDEIRTGAYQNLFDPSSLITWWEDGASNFARGYHEIGNAVLERTLDKIRRIADDCDSLEVMFTYFYGEPPSN